MNITSIPANLYNLAMGKSTQAVLLLLILTLIAWVPAKSENPAPQVIVGDALRWQTISSYPTANGYEVLMLVADWDKDGADEILLPAGAVFSRRLDALKDMSFVMELDGTVRPVPLNGLCLQGVATVWDYNRDGFPEIVVDSGGWADLTFTKRTRAAKVFADKSQLEEFNQSEAELTALTEELQSLDPQATDFFESSFELLGGLSGHNIFYGLEWKSHEGFGEYGKSMDALQEGLEPGQTVVLNLAGKRLAKLPGTLTGPGSLPVGNYYGTQGDDLVLVDYGTRDQETGIPPPAKLLCYSKGAKLVKRHTCQNTYQPGAVGDIDNDGKLELLETTSGEDFLPQILTGKLGSTGKPLQTPKFDDSGFAEASLCFDLNHDGWAETLVGTNLVWDSRNKTSIELDTPPGFDGARPFASNNANVTYFALTETSPVLTWVTTTHGLEGTGLAAYDASGKLKYFEELGGPILWITRASGEGGKPVLLVQTERRILVWPQGGLHGVPLTARAGTSRSLR